MISLISNHSSPFKLFRGGRETQNKKVQTVYAQKPQQGVVNAEPRECFVGSQPRLDVVFSWKILSLTLCLVCLYIQSELKIINRDFASKVFSIKLLWPFYNDVNKLLNSRENKKRLLDFSSYDSLTRPLLSTEFSSLLVIPFSKISLKQSFKTISLHVRDARSSFVTTSTWSRLILKALRRTDNNELLQMYKKRKFN